MLVLKEKQLLEDTSDYSIHLVACEIKDCRGCMFDDITLCGLYSAGWEWEDTDDESLICPTCLELERKSAKDGRS